MRLPLIVMETEEWFVLDKPSGMSVHNDAGRDLISFAKDQGWGSDRAFPLHRLDRMTGGLVLFAKGAKAASKLQASFTEAGMKKTYLARCLVLKHEDQVEMGKTGQWRWPLTNRAESRAKPQGFWRLRIPCQTGFEILSYEAPLLDIKLWPLTGRQHQLRRHLAIKGWPLLGDKRYGRKEEGGDGGGFLIAKELEFFDPFAREWVQMASGLQLAAPFKERQVWKPVGDDRSGGELGSFYG